MRVLFVDFDGVLHPLGLWIETTRSFNGCEVALTEPVDYFCWAPSLAEQLSLHDDVRIVVHSSWRVWYPHDQIGEYLGPLGPRFLGCTNDSRKCESILAWLAAHPAVRSYRILDDDMLEFVDERVARQLIACDHRTGVAGQSVRAKLADWLRAT